MKNTVRLMSAWCVSAMVLVSVPGTGLAQEGQSKARGWLRVLPVGDAPPFRQVIEGGVRRQLPAP